MREMRHWIALTVLLKVCRHSGAADIPCGPVYTISRIAGRFSLRSRGAILSVVDPLSRCDVLVPAGYCMVRRRRAKHLRKVSADESTPLVTRAFNAATRKDRAT